MNLLIEDLYKLRVIGEGECPMWEGEKSGSTFLAGEMYGGGNVQRGNVRYSSPDFCLVLAYVPRD